MLLALLFINDEKCEMAEIEYQSRIFAAGSRSHPTSRLFYMWERLQSMKKYSFVIFLLLLKMYSIQ